ncbi:MAG: hypothetical protein ABIR59_04000 [Gemmatimonadales bacterium]
MAAVRKAQWRAFPTARPLMLTALGCAIGLLGCSSGDRSASRGDTLTARQRDSLIGASKLPGASGVNSANRLADSAAARRAREAAAATDP